MRHRAAIKKLLDSHVVEAKSVDEHLRLLDSISSKYPVARLTKEVVTLKALSDPMRLKILRTLAERKMCVCEIEYISGLSQPTVSYHLKILVSAGVLKRVEKGKWSLYSIANEKVTCLLKALDDIL